MRTLLSLALIGLCFSLTAQETINYPYNPDGDVDGTIASPDLLDILGVYGNAFTPTEIQIDGVGLAEVINQMQAIIIELQDEINTLQLQNQWPTVVDGNLIISGADLSFAELSNADLSNADLSNADLSNADLSYADLFYANLSYAYLSNADLSYAGLFYANLSYADLSYADLSYANLSYATLAYATLSGVTWSGAYIEGCMGCNCVDANGDNYCD